MNQAVERRWIGYDWFKLIVGLVLTALLLLFRPTAGTESTAVTPATSSPAVATAAPRVQIVAPVLTSPGAGLQAAPGPITFSGTAAPGVEVQVLVDGAPVGKVRVGADGAWTLNVTVDKPGAHQIVVQALDDKGAVAAAANPATLSISAPTPQIAATASQLALPTLDLPNQPLTAGDVVLSGTGIPGAKIGIVVDGAPAIMATVGTDGKWSLPVTLSPGDHEIVAQTLDTTGQVAAAASPLRVSVSAAAQVPTAETGANPTAETGGTTTGQAPVITTPADGAELDGGPITISGTGVAGSQIEILDSDKVIGTVAVGADGTWSFEATPSGNTAAYSARPAGSTDVTAKPIRVTVGTAAAGTCNDLAVNCDAWVTRTGGLVLRMRAGAGTSQSIIARLPVGTQMKLLEGPQPANEHNWWRVLTIGGREGWVAGEELRTQPD
jgi:hypothetical protein